MADHEIEKEMEDGGEKRWREGGYGELDMNIESEGKVEDK